VKFQLNDRVYKLGDWKSVYKIVAIHKHKLLCQIQRGKRVATFAGHLLLGNPVAERTPESVALSVEEVRTVEVA
jgi:hypothetical protein